MQTSTMQTQTTIPTPAAGRRSFERQVCALRESLYGAAMRLTRNAAEADDLVQDTLFRAWRFWATYTQGTNIKAWLFTILRNTFINGYHSRGRRAAALADVAASQGPAPELALAGSYSTPPGPEFAVAELRRRERLEAALEQLPEQFRLAVRLADVEQLSYREIAEVLDCPLGTVMSRVHRGREALHLALAAEAIADEIVPATTQPGVRRTPYTRTR